jgi:hypothetical protein
MNPESGGDAGASTEWEMDNYFRKCGMLEEIR